MVGATVTCGNDAEEHIATLRSCVDAGFDEVYVGQIGPDSDAFFDRYRSAVLPASVA